MTHTGAAAMLMLAGMDAECPVLSITCTVNKLVPLPVGVPDMIPVPAARERPAGSVPDTTDHVTGAVQLDVWTVNV
jgi:hypothetical protein